MIRAGRLPDWSERLFACLVAHQGRPFVWGETDCATLFADAVAAVTGADPLAAHRPWDSQRAAGRVLLRSGCASVLAFVERHFDEIVPADARRGDIGFTTAAHPLMSPAIVTGAEAVSRDETGWLVLPRSALVRAFKVG